MHPNEAKLRRVHAAAFSQSELPLEDQENARRTIVEVFGGAKFTFFGDTVYCAQHTTPEDSWNKYATIQRLTAGTFREDLLGCCANDEMGCIWAMHRGELNGVAFAYPAVQISRFEAGVVKETWEFFHPDHFRLWPKLEPAGDR